MAVTKEILNSHPVATLKREIGKTNLKGYSKMKKAELVDFMMNNKDKFGHIRKKGEASAPASKPKKEEKPADPKQYSFDFYYTGSGTQMNQFVNDVIDLKSNKTNRKVGIKSVRSKVEKFLKDKKKKGENVSNQMVRKFLDDTYPSNLYYPGL